MDQYDDADQPWDAPQNPLRQRRTIHHPGALERARSGVAVLRALAAVIALAGLIGAAITITGFEEESGSMKFAQFLLTNVSSLGIAAIVVGLSMLVDLYAARLAHDMANQR